MYSVGIDISKGKSTVAIMKPFGEVEAKPYEVLHQANELGVLVELLKGLPGETRVIMEYTGKYYQPIASYLYNAGIFVSAVHAKLIHDYGNNSIRQVKTDRADAIKIANYGIAHWESLSRYTPTDENRFLLKTYNRQYNQYMKLRVALKNNLIALLDQTFPNANKLFTSPVRSDGHEKWVDFAAQFWHCHCISRLTKTRFIVQYNKWCKHSGYYGSDSKASEIYEFACSQIAVLSYNQGTRMLIEQAVAQINTISKTIAFVRNEMKQLASLLPEYPVVMTMCGVGDILGPQLIAEIGDVRRFPRKQSLVAFAGVDAPPFQSGSYESKNRSISKRGSPALRKTLFQIMGCILQNSPAEDAVFQFLDRKRSEGKRYYVYMVAGGNKFLRIYYAKVKEYLNSLDTVV